MLIRKIVHLEKTSSGRYVPGEVLKADNKKKVAGGLKPLEKRLRKRAKAQRRFAETYLERHERSNEKKRNGFLRDLVWNVLRARGKARRVLRG